MLLFIVIALSIFWVCGCLLALALGAMLARTDGRGPAVGQRRGRGLAADRFAPVDRLAAEHMLPIA